MTAQAPIRVLLVDDHNLVRRGLASLLSADGRFTVVAEAADGQSALEALQAHPVDLVILDLCMPRMSGLEVIRRMEHAAGPAKLLVLSMYDDEQFVAQALRHGAKGYLLKHAMDDELFRALETVARGGRYVSQAIDLTRSEGLSLTSTELTTREREVLQLIVDGLTTHAVAERLAISVHTATRHRANLMQKLDAHNQVELLRKAAKLGLIILPQQMADDARAT
ncbi:MAG: response regulator transcription factor [Vicinamibacterales bacterium]